MSVLSSRQRAATDVTNAGARAPFLLSGIYETFRGETAICSRVITISEVAKIHRQSSFAPRRSRLAVRAPVWNHRSTIAAFEFLALPRLSKGVSVAVAPRTTLRVISRAVTRDIALRRAVARRFVRRRKSIVPRDGCSHLHLVIHGTHRKALRACLTYNSRDYLGGRDHYTFVAFSDKNELVAAQNFLQQAAETNLVSKMTLRVASAKSLMIILDVKIVCVCFSMNLCNDSALCWSQSARAPSPVWLRVYSSRINSPPRIPI